MADYIRFRLNAAKVGVSMALLAAIGGLAEKAQARSDRATAKPAAVGFLKLGGLSHAISSPLLKIENKLIKLDKKLSTLQNKDKQFLKIKDASLNFLKIEDANSTFLKIADANSTFLKIGEATNKFLKIDGTAANSAELGGLKPDAFVQGNGGVVSAGILIGLSQPSVPLLKTPDGKLAIAISATSDQVTLNFTNNTGGALEAVGQDANGSGGGAAIPQTIAPGAKNSITLQGTTNQYHLQIFPNGANEAMTLTLSTEQDAANKAQLDVVAQMLIGLL